MKLLVAGCVFSSMFGSAWFINEKIKREYVEPIAFEDSSIKLTNSETPVDFLNEEANVFEKFKPREYVRVVVR
jgi:hypothetical protein